MKKYIRNSAAIMISAVLLGACSLPHQYDKKPLQKPEELAQAIAFQEIEKINWPSDTWWTRYHDAQLDQLIQEALLNSPAMAVAEARLKQAGGLLAQTGSLKNPGRSGSRCLDDQSQLSIPGLHGPARLERLWIHRP